MGRTTVSDLRRKKADNDKIVMITAYDATMARLVDLAGVDMVLVGDSLGMVVQGRDDTLAVTLDEVIYHTRCVARGLQQAHLTADLPFGTYQAGPGQALASASRVLKESGAQSVKLEGGVRSAAAIEACVQAGIPVVGHIGLTPQSVHAMGGFRVQGRTEEAADELLEDARAVEAAGAFCLVLEGMPSVVAARVTQAVSIPTIGIGAGEGCDGQVLVVNDVLGLDASFKPRFVKRYAELQDVIVGAVGRYAREVRDGRFPAPEHGFQMRQKTVRLEKLY